MIIKHNDHNSPMESLNSSEWVYMACDWCGSENYDVVFRGKDLLEHLPGEFQVVRCKDCGLLRQYPYLSWSSLKSYYPETYASHGLMVQDQSNFWKRLDKRVGPWKRLRAVELHHRGGSLLEVGCGTGTFLEEAIRSGHWQVTGVEPTAHAAEYARSRLNVIIHQDVFANVVLPENSFDTIVMWNVLEHLENPIRDMRYAYKLLKPGGWFIFSIPNLHGWEKHLFKQYWVGWDLPRHLYFFSRPLLQTILPSLGLRWVDARCLSTSYHLLGESLEFWSQSWQDRHPTIRRILLSSYKSFLGRGFASIPLSIMDVLALNTSITIFSQKYPMLGEDL